MRTRVFCRESRTLQTEDKGSLGYTSITAAAEASGRTIYPWYTLSRQQRTFFQFVFLTFHVNHSPPRFSHEDQHEVSLGIPVTKLGEIVLISSIMDLNERDRRGIVKKVFVFCNLIGPFSMIVGL